MRPGPAPIRPAAADRARHAAMRARLSADLDHLQANRPNWWRPLRRHRWATLIITGHRHLEATR